MFENPPGIQAHGEWISARLLSGSQGKWRLL